MRKKIVILNRTSQYRVGVFSEHCFFHVFFAAFARALRAKLLRKIFANFEQKSRGFFVAGGARLCGIRSLLGLARL